ncbi:MAG: hypothetical protein WCP29_00050 [Acidobacteriota bacterium]
MAAAVLVLGCGVARLSASADTSIASMPQAGHQAAPAPAAKPPAPAETKPTTPAETKKPAPAETKPTTPAETTHSAPVDAKAVAAKPDPAADRKSTPTAAPDAKSSHAETPADATKPVPAADAKSHSASPAGGTKPAPAKDSPGAIAAAKVGARADVAAAVTRIQSIMVEQATAKSGKGGAKPGAMAHGSPGSAANQSGARRMPPTGGVRLSWEDLPTDPGGVTLEWDPDLARLITVTKPGSGIRLTWPTKSP